MAVSEKAGRTPLSAITCLFRSGSRIGKALDLLPKNIHPAGEPFVVMQAGVLCVYRPLVAFAVR